MSYQVYKEYVNSYHASLGMRTFVVAYLSLHDGALKQQLIYATDQLAAANLVLDTSHDTMELVYEYAANTDSWISVLEVNNTLTE